MRKWLFLASAQRLGDFTLLLLRLFVGLFLIWGVWDNLSSSERMHEFVDFLGKHGFSSPRLMAPLSVYLQLAIGVAFILGLFTRWAGVLCAVHFAIAIGLYLATYGAGRVSIDAALRANELPRVSGGVRLKR
jgi:putative oxidoreductase